MIKQLESNYAIDQRQKTNGYTGFRTNAAIKLAPATGASINLNQLINGSSHQHSPQRNQYAMTPYHHERHQSHPPLTAVDGGVGPIVDKSVEALPPTSAIDIEKLVKLAKTPQGISSVISSTSRGPRTPKIPTYITTDAN